MKLMVVRQGPVKRLACGQDLHQLVLVCTSLIVASLHDYVCILISVTCQELSAPANGMVTVTGQRSGATATYSCDSGYEVDGSVTRTCQATGMWSGSEPTCVGMYVFDCG